MQELLSRLAAMPQRLRAIAANVRDPYRKPSAEAFSLLEHACHLRDIERLAYTDRITRILTEDLPELKDVDGGRVAEESDYHGTQHLDAALDEFAALRAANLGRFASLTEGEWGREGVLEDVGRITLADLAARMDQHDREHLSELEAL